MAAALPIIAAVATAVGTIQEGLAARAQAKSAANAAEFNAQVARNNATLARQTAEQEANDIREETRVLIARQRAIQAASGVVIGGGSSLLATREQASEGEIASRRRLFEGDVEAQGFTTQSLLLEAEAEASREQGNAAFTTSLLKAGGQAAGSFSGSNLFSSGSTAPVPVPNPRRSSLLTGRS